MNKPKPQHRLHPYPSFYFSPMIKSERFGLCTNCNFFYRPYLLVDVRDQSEYDQCHIITALSYPASNFSRTMNPFSPEMYQFRNVDGKIIILYDVDEFIATECAHKMAQRGFENIFVVSFVTIFMWVLTELSNQF